MKNKFLKITTIATIGALACYIANKYNIRAELSIKGDIPEKLANLIARGTYRWLNLKKWTGATKNYLSKN